MKLHYASSILFGVSNLLLCFSIGVINSNNANKVLVYLIKNGWVFRIDKLQLIAKLKKDEALLIDLHDSTSIENVDVLKLDDKVSYGLFLEGLFI